MVSCVPSGMACRAIAAVSIAVCSKCSGVGQASAADFVRGYAQPHVLPSEPFEQAIHAGENSVAASDPTGRES